MNKYHNIPTEHDGILFDSKREATRYQELKLLQYAGEIGAILVQPAFPLTVNDVFIGSYYADFSYPVLATGETIYEDVKGGNATITPVFRLKVKLVKALYGVEVRIV